MRESEHEAWDRYAAAALEALVGQVHPPNHGGSVIEDRAATAAKYADNMMTERRKRFVGARNQ